MREILLYSPIFSFIAELFIKEVEEAKDENITARLFTPGGDPLAVWGMIAKLREHENKVSIKVDGEAVSAGAYFLLFFDDVEALSQSRFILHRASIFNEGGASEKDLTTLKEINKDLRIAMEAKLDIPEFEKLAGVTLDEFFNSENVIDVSFNAKNAKKIKLIKKIVNLAPETITALGKKFAAYYKEQPANKPEEQKKPTEKMTKVEFKAQSPELFNEIFNDGVTQGVTAEKDRAGAWMAFVAVDPTAVVEGVKGNENLSQTVMAEFALKKMSPKTLKKIEEEKADETQTEEPTTEAGIKAKAQKEFETEVQAGLDFKKDKK